MSVNAKELAEKVKAWARVDKKVGRLQAAHVEAGQDLRNAEGEVKGAANELFDMLNTDGRIRTHRVFLPASGDAPATVVRIMVGTAIPVIEAFPVDVVADG